MSESKLDVTMLSSNSSAIVLFSISLEFWSTVESRPLASVPNSKILLSMTDAACFRLRPLLCSCYPLLKETFL